MPAIASLGYHQLPQTAMQCQLELNIKEQQCHHMVMILIKCILCQLDKLLFGCSAAPYALMSHLAVGGGQKLISFICLVIKTEVAQYV